MKNASATCCAFFLLFTHINLSKDKSHNPTEWFSCHIKRRLCCVCNFPPKVNGTTKFSKKKIFAKESSRVNSRIRARGKLPQCNLRCPFCFLLSPWLLPNVIFMRIWWFYCVWTWGFLLLLQPPLAENLRKKYFLFDRHNRVKIAHRRHAISRISWKFAILIIHWETIVVIETSCWVFNANFVPMHTRSADLSLDFKQSKTDQSRKIMHISFSRLIDRETWNTSREESFNLFTSPSLDKQRFNRKSFQLWLFYWVVSFAQQFRCSPSDEFIGSAFSYIMRITPATSWWWESITEPTWDHEQIIIKKSCHNYMLTSHADLSFQLFWSQCPWDEGKVESLGWKVGLHFSSFWKFHLQLPRL